MKDTFYPTVVELKIFSAAAVSRVLSDYVFMDHHSLIVLHWPLQRSCRPLLLPIIRERHDRTHFPSIRLVNPHPSFFFVTIPAHSGMPCLTTSLFEGGYRKCDVNFELNRVMEEMKPILCTWTGAKGMNRGDAMPHLNTYYRYREIRRSGGEVALIGGLMLHGGTWWYWWWSW